MNNVSYYPHSLSVQTHGGDLKFNTLLPLVVRAKSVKVYGPKKCFCLPQHKLPTVIAD